MRFSVRGLVVTCVLATLAMVAASSKASIQYDELTCDELLHSYHFNITVMRDIRDYYDGCVAYQDESIDTHNHGKLTCEFIKEHALFVEGIVNDLAGVYNIKCAAE